RGPVPDRGGSLRSCDGIVPVAPRPLSLLRDRRRAGARRARPAVLLRQALVAPVSVSSLLLGLVSKWFFLRRHKVHFDASSQSFGRSSSSEPAATTARARSTCASSDATSTPRWLGA